MKKVKELPFDDFCVNIIREGKYILHEGVPEIKLLIYKNRKNILAIHSDTGFFQISSIRNQKNFTRTIAELKEKFRDNLESKIIPISSEEQEKIDIENKLNSLLEKKRQRQKV